MVDSFKLRSSLGLPGGLCGTRVQNFRGVFSDLSESSDLLSFRCGETVIPSSRMQNPVNIYTRQMALSTSRGGRRLLLQLLADTIQNIWEPLLTRTPLCRGADQEYPLVPSLQVRESRETPM